MNYYVAEADLTIEELDRRIRVSIIYLFVAKIEMSKTFSRW